MKRFCWEVTTRFCWEVKCQNVGKLSKFWCQPPWNCLEFCNVAILRTERAKMKAFLVLPMLASTLLGGLVYKIETIDTFFEFVNLARESTTRVVAVDVDLQVDLDLIAHPLDYAIGQLNLGECNTWSGTFEGNGHVVKISRQEGSDAIGGLFCYIENATIRNLVIDKSTYLNQYCAAALSCTASTFM